MTDKLDLDAIESQALAYISTNQWGAGVLSHVEPREVLALIKRLRKAETAIETMAKIACPRGTTCLMMGRKEAEEAYGEWQKAR